MTKASKGSVKEYLNRAQEVHQSHLTFIDVAEFGDDGEPVRIYAKKPTIADLSAITRDSRTEKGHDDPFEQALRTVVRLAMDEKGDPLFTIEHLQVLRKNVDADVIEHLAARMRTGISFEAAKKN